MTYEFKSSVSRGGSVLTPEVITIDDYSITWSKCNKYLIGKDIIIIPITKIASIRIDAKIWGADIYIGSYDNQFIVGRNFTVSDAKEISKIINSIISQNQTL